MAKARLLGIIAIMLAFLALAPSITSAAGCGTMPSSLVSLTEYCIPISISNTVSTSGTFQTMLTFNASHYSSYLASNVINIYIYNSISGTAVPSWIEGNVLNEQQTKNLNTVTDLVIWANVPTPQSPTADFNALYVGIGSTSTDFLANANAMIGAAPQLYNTSGAPQTSYGQYNNCASVFNFCDDFATLNKTTWNQLSGGVYPPNVVNGIESSSTSFQMGNGNTDFNPQVYAFDVLANMQQTGGGSFPQISSSSSNINGVPLFRVQNTTTTCIIVHSYSPDTSSSCLSNSAALYPSLNVYTTWATSTTDYMMANYNTTGQVSVVSDGSQTTGYIWFNGGIGNGKIVLQWVDARLLPPSGAMPSTSFGTLQQAPSVSLSISPNPATYGQSITLTATCNTGDSCAIDYPSLGTAIATGTGSATYTYNPFALAAGSYSSYYANDITAGTTSVAQTLTVNKVSPVLSLTNCTSGALPYSCTTTGTITTHNNQLTASLYRNNNLIGTSNTAVSDTLSNTIGTYAYTFNTLGNPNYTTNTISVSFYKYVPMTFYNITNGAQATHTITPPKTTTDFTYYPYRLNVSSFNGIAYTLTQSYDGGTATTLFSSAASIGYNPPANQATGNYLYALTETQASNTMLFNLSLVPANMLDINSALTFNSYNDGCIQYLPCLASFVSNTPFTAKPSSWKIITANQPIGNQHTNTSAGEQFDSPNTSLAHFNRDITLTYDQFTPIFSFSPNAINNPLLQTSLTLTKFEFLANALTPSAPYTRELYSITTYDQRTSAPLSTNTSVSQTDLLNNYTIANTTPLFTGNAFKVWMPISTYQNPNITTTPQVSSQANGFFLAVNNYCTAIVQNGNYRTFQAYPVDANGSLYTISVYKGYATGAVGDFMQIWSGIGNASAKQVQQYRIAYNPFALALENGGSYSFRFLNSNCGLIYATNYTIWSNPITINLPQNLSTPTIQIPNATATCLTTAAAGNTVNVVCSGEDYKNLIKSWNLTLANTSSFSGYLTIESNTINGSSFSKTYTGLSKFDVYQVRIVAVQGDPTFQNAWTFSINGNFITQGFGIGADGFIAILFLLAGLGFGKMGTGEGGFAAGHQISLTLWIEAFMVFILWASGILTFIPVAGIVAMIGLLIIIGALSSRYEGGAYYG